MEDAKILVTGANGQIGTVLTKALKATYGDTHVIATDIRPATQGMWKTHILDVTQRSALEEVVHREKVGYIFHLAALLSATAEQKPQQAWEVNMSGWTNVLEVAHAQGVRRVFFPSSIAVFGPHTHRQLAPQFGPLTPTTIYGVTKVAGELLGQYYWHKYGLDVRSLRYPGIVGYQSLPGGGTTDYAIDIFYKALQGQPYTCFLNPDTRLPMMYMDDAIRATIELMKAPVSKIRVRIGYNIAAMSFTPAQLAEAIRTYIPDLQVTYRPDFRQEIAASWPEQIDDTHARNDWEWQSHFDLDAMTQDMITHLKDNAMALSQSQQ